MITQWKSGCYEYRYKSKSRQMGGLKLPSCTAKETNEGVKGKEWEKIFATRMYRTRC